MQLCRTKDTIFPYSSTTRAEKIILHIYAIIAGYKSKTEVKKNKKCLFESTVEHIDLETSEQCTFFKTVCKKSIF